MELSEYERKRFGVGAKYADMNQKGQDTIWCSNPHDIRGDETRKRRWDYSHIKNDLNVIPPAMPDDFGLDFLRKQAELNGHEKFLKHHKAYRDSVRDSKFLGISSGKGVVFFDQWAVLGNWLQVNSVIDWSRDSNSLKSSKKLMVDNSTGFFDRAVRLAKGSRPFYFSVVRRDYAKLTIDANLDFLLRPLGNRGRLQRTNNKSAEFSELLTDQQKLRSSIEAIKMQLNSCLLYTSPSPRDS